MKNSLKIMVIGSLNTDIIGLRVPRIVNKGELAYGGELRIGPGGKARNIAEMIAKLLPPYSVGIIARTCKDPYGFWKPPIEALKKAHVDISALRILSYEVTKKFPGVALIPVDQDGKNQIYVLPGISTDFCFEDIDRALHIFDDVSAQKGALVVSLEMPLKTVLYAMKIAKEKEIKILIDPGGLSEQESYQDIFSYPIFLLKPNIQETHILSGIRVIDFQTAHVAAQIFMKLGVQNVLITAGRRGGYFFSENLAMRIPIPPIQPSIGDETGCGDQTMATLSALIIRGFSITEAVRYAIMTGTMQFQKEGVQPISKQDLQCILQKGPLDTESECCFTTIMN